jgi:prevent-host-death family protein
MLVSVSVLKANLSRLLARAQDGEVIEVLSDGKPIARIVGIPAAQHHLPKKFPADNSINWNGKKPIFAKDLPTLSMNGRSLGKIIRQDRN